MILENGYAGGLTMIVKEYRMTKVIMRPIIRCLIWSMIMGRDCERVRR